MKWRKKMKDEKETAGDQPAAWWDEEWALKDKTRINRKKQIPADDIKSWINKALEKGVEARFWYLKTDVIMRVKSLIVQDEKWEDLMYLGKRIGIIRRELGDAQGSLIIHKAVCETEDELAKDGMTHKEIKAKLEKLIKQMGETPVF
jgi:hypothetical protein